MSALGLGAAALGGEYGAIDPGVARATVHAALDAGITLIDVSPYYGRTAAETVLGSALRGVPRDSYILATKVWGQMSDDPDDRGLSASQIAKQIDASLERLRTDYVDLYQAHRFDPDVAIEETIEALQKVVADGDGERPLADLDGGDPLTIPVRARW